MLPEPDPHCTFCQIVAGVLPSHKVWESKSHLAFLNIYPNRLAMTLVIPKSHTPSDIFSVEDSIIASTVLAAKDVAHAIERSFPEVQRVALVFEGLGVAHLHAKLYPLRSQEEHGRLDTADGERADSVELDRIATIIRAHVI